MQLRQDGRQLRVQSSRLKIQYVAENEKKKKKLNDCIKHITSYKLVELNYNPMNLPIQRSPRYSYIYKNTEL